MRHVRSRSLIWYALRALAAFPLLLVCACPGGGSSSTYACPNLPGAKCYGVTIWPPSALNAPVGTVMTYFTPVALNGSDGHMTDEVWLLACSDAGCTNISGWVEAGEVAGPDEKGCQIPSNEAHWFWADQRPGKSFFCHDLGPVAQADFGKQASVAIGVNPPLPGEFFVNGFSATAHPLYGISTSNSMQQNAFEIGMELSATHAAGSGGTAYFGPNSFAPPQSDVFSDPTSNGLQRVDSPINAGWSGYFPSESPSQAVWTTQCCSF
jgi:hypothetical protein